MENVTNVTISIYNTLLSYLFVTSTIKIGVRMYKNMRLKGLKKAQTLNTGILVSLVSVVILLVIVSIVMSFGAQINDDVQDDFTTDSYAYNVTQEGLEGLETLSEKQNTWALIIGVGVVITLLLGFL